MSVFRVYIKPFDADGNYLDDFIEVTPYTDFDSLGQIKQEVDNDQYNVGIFKFGQVSITFINDFGKFSEPEVFASIFRYKRNDSILKITYAIDIPAYAGAAISGESFISEEVEIFTGFINDESSSMDLATQKITFRVLGYESLFSRVEVPYAELAPGDFFSDLIFKCLNQSPIYPFLEVHPGNIEPGIDVASDVVENLQNKTVKEALDTLLLVSNSILFIRDQTIFVRSREATEEVTATFYGQASNNGIENIIDIADFRNGVNKVFNYWTWRDTVLIAKDVDSLVIHGVKKKEVDFESITDDSKREIILEGLKDEFKEAKNEMELAVPISYDNLELFMLDKVVVDYPTVLITAEGADIPIYGSAIYGQAVYPIAQWSLTIPPTEYYKIMGRTVDCKAQLIKFKLREV